MVRNRKVWGVLGLLLALVVVVGYGQEPPVGRPLELKYVFTVNNGCTGAAGGKLELFVMDNDVHPTRNIMYQNDPASVAGFPRPDNPGKCPGVAYFFPGTGTVQVLTRPGLSPAGTYRFKLCLRKPPGVSGADPIVTVGAAAVSITPQTGDRCQCPTNFDMVRTLPPPSDASVSWDFKVDKQSVEFCRVEVWY